MLTELRLRGWQCHKAIDLQLGQVTVLCGQNDGGKSSIMRALEFLALNLWDGDANSHVTWGQEYSEITLVVDEHTITRQKGPGLNTYFLDDREPYRAFHPKTPEPITKLLRISEANFQKQDSPAFWISLRGGQAASVLNELFHLNVIDSTLANVGAEVRKAKKSVVETDTTLAAASKQRDDLAWTEGAATLLTELEDLATAAHYLEEEIQRLTYYDRSQQETLQFMEHAGEVLQLGEEALALSANFIPETQARLDRLLYAQRLAQEIQSEEKTLAQQEAVLSKELAGKCPLCLRGDKK